MTPATSVVRSAIQCVLSCESEEIKYLYLRVLHAHFFVFLSINGPDSLWPARLSIATQHRLFMTHPYHDGDLPSQYRFSVSVSIGSVSVYYFVPGPSLTERDQSTCSCGQWNNDNPVNKHEEKCEVNTIHLKNNNCRVNVLLSAVQN